MLGPSTLQHVAPTHMTPWKKDSLKVRAAKAFIAGRLRGDQHVGSGEDRQGNSFYTLRSRGSSDPRGNAISGDVI